MYKFGTIRINNLQGIMPKEIPLTRGYVAIVDDEDYECLSAFSWHAHISNMTVYARRREGHGGPAFYMHKEILPGGKIDHRDGNGLNNCRSNLRHATQAQNMQNRRSKRSSTSRFKGVHFYKARGNWMTTFNGKFIGYFPTEREAALAYNELAKQEYGEFARLNEVA
jgi:hypothetical protein